MGTITIINGNTNDKDNTKVFMVKGQDGVSPTIDLEETTGQVKISVTDYDGTEETTISDPVVSVTKNDGVATITMTDKNGTTTATVADGADLTDGAVPQGAVMGFDGETVPAGYEEVNIDNTASLIRNDTYVYSTDFDVKCITIGNYVFLNINIISFKSALDNGDILISNLPPAKNYTITGLFGIVSASGNTCRVAVTGDGELRIHYGNPLYYGDPANYQYAGIVIYEKA